MGFNPRSTAGSTFESQLVNYCNLSSINLLKTKNHMVIWINVEKVSDKIQHPFMICCCSVTKLCSTVSDPVNCSSPGFPVLYYLPEFEQTHVCWVSDAIHPFHPLSSPSPPTLNLSQHQGLFQWIGSSHQVAKVLELQLQHQSFQWVFRIDFLLRLTGLILQSRGLSRVFSNTTVQKHQFFGAQPSLWPNSHIRDYWKNHSFDFMGAL